jgi:asparagine synthase (glutamine-hydrolysing)
MCGIAGIYSLKNKKNMAEDILIKMISILQHRGPDETGIYLDNAIGLANARLSIIGLDDGTQPLCNEDSTLWIVYNGETFNYIELKEELIQRGHRFSTHSDTEVILHLYEEYGPECLGKINGEFAIAIWDSVKKELFLARDRVGIKPLFFTRVKGKFLFASEIKALFQDPEVSRQIDPEALAQVFTYWTTVTPKTAFKGVFELPPGHFMKIDELGDVTPKPYWRIPYYSAGEQWRGTFDEAQEELRRLLKDAVALRLRADVPVGAYLSGGLDSSILSSLISRNFNNRLRTFSLSFQEKPFDEFSFQKEMVQSLGTEHSQVKISNNQVRENFPQVVWLCEKPLLRTGPVPLYLLSKLVRESQFKVVLTGEGADEVFGGYNIFKEAKLRNFWRQQPDSKCRPMLVERLYPYIFKNPSRTRVFLQQFFSTKQEDVYDPFVSHRSRWKNGEKNIAFLSENVRENLSKYDPYTDLIGRLP